SEFGPEADRMQTKRTMARVGFGLADMLKVVKRNIIHRTSTTMNGVETESGGWASKPRRVCWMSELICSARVWSETSVGVFGCRSRTMARAVELCLGRPGTARPAARSEE